MYWFTSRGTQPCLGPLEKGFLLAKGNFTIITLRWGILPWVHKISLNTLNFSDHCHLILFYWGLKLIVLIAWFLFLTSLYVLYPIKFTFSKYDKLLSHNIIHNMRLKTYYFEMLAAPSARMIEICHFNSNGL